MEEKTFETAENFPWLSNEDDERFEAAVSKAWQEIKDKLADEEAEEDYWRGIAEAKERGEYIGPEPPLPYVKLAPGETIPPMINADGITNEPIEETLTAELSPDASIVVDLTPMQVQVLEQWKEYP
jgi:hypothetical protein